jgi:hypothetical protein
MGDNTAKINQLQRHFQGNNIDRDVLESVLLICDGDVNAAIQFLTAQEGQQAYNPNQNPDGVPADYPGKHKSVSEELFNVMVSLLNIVIASRTKRLVLPSSQITTKAMNNSIMCKP